MRYTVQVLGGYNPLYEGNSLTEAENMRMRWTIKVKALQVAVILVDNSTGEILAGA